MLEQILILSFFFLLECNLHPSIIRLVLGNLKNCIFTTYIYPANIYLFKVNKRNTRKRCEICFKLTINISEKIHNYRGCRFKPLTILAKKSSDVVQVSLLLTLNYFTPFTSASIIDFKQENVCNLQWRARTSAKTWDGELCNTVNGFRSLTIAEKLSILDVCGNPSYILRFASLIVIGLDWIGMLYFALTK